MMDSEKKYPAVAKEYKLYEEVGEGVSATVYRALCIPANEIVAIKVLDLEKCNGDLDGIRREVQTMNLIDHPNVLRAYCSFTSGYNLWIVMPYMAGGSCLHIMKSAYPEGFEEPVIATLLKETLKALVYLHSEGHIHRDVKAGNILMDTNGSVKLADFGVSASMFDTGDRQRSRNTFVGTPCWMAPEVMQQLHGYDFKADIWSFGITALELAHGHAPFSKYPPMKVLLMTLQNAPPGLDYERDKRFSKSFKELVAACLVKDPKKRPTSEKLLKHHFFKHARSNDYISRTVLDGLHPLGERFKIIKAKDADLLIQNKARYGDMEQLSQKEYIKGISAWNFNLDDLKNQAAMIQDDHHVMTNINYDEKSMDQSEREVYNYDDDAISTESLSLSRDNISDGSLVNEDNVNCIHDVADSLAAFPLKPLQALTKCFDFGEEDISSTGLYVKGLEQTDSHKSFNESQSTVANQESDIYRIDNAEQCTSFRRRINLENKKNFSGPLLIDNVMLPRKISEEDNRDPICRQILPERSYSGPLLQRMKKENIDDTSEAVVKHKGRFKVTSAEGSNCGHNLFNSGAHKFSTSLIASIQSISQHNTAQRDEINKLMKYLEQPFGIRDTFLKSASSNEMLQISKEKELQALAMIHEQSIKNLTEELQKLKLKNIELEELLNSKRQSGKF